MLLLICLFLLRLRLQPNLQLELQLLGLVHLVFDVLESGCLFFMFNLDEVVGE